MHRRVTVVGFSVCLSVCVSVFKSHHNSGACVCPEATVMYSVGNQGQNICRVFSETVLLQRPSVESRTYGRPYSCG